MSIHPCKKRRWGNRKVIKYQRRSLTFENMFNVNIQLYFHSIWYKEGNVHPPGHAKTGELESNQIPKGLPHLWKYVHIQLYFHSVSYKERNEHPAMQKQENWIKFQRRSLTFKISLEKCKLANQRALAISFKPCILQIKGSLKLLVQTNVSIKNENEEPQGNKLNHYINKSMNWSVSLDIKFLFTGLTRLLSRTR